MKCPRCGRNAEEEGIIIDVFGCTPCHFRWQRHSKGGVYLYTYGPRTGLSDGSDVFQVPKGTLPVFIEEEL